METTSSLDAPIIERPSTSRVNLLYAVVAAYCLHISTGAVMAWPSPMILRLNLTSTENSLLSSLFSLGAAPGTAITTLGIDTIGRKGTLLLISFSFATSWILLLISQNIIVMYASRLIGGMGIGGSFAGVSLYVAEICDEETRGWLNSLTQTFIALGLLLEYTVGPFVSYTVLAAVSLSVTALFPVLFFFAPESPHYLIAKGKTKEAYSSLLWLRTNITEEGIHKEITDIEISLKKEKESYTGVKKLCTSPAVHKGMAICIFLVMMQQGSGMNAVLAYVQFIFENASLHLEPEVVPILVGVTNLVASLPAPFLVKKCGYKIVFFVSAFGSAICLLLLGLYFYLMDNNYARNIGFLPVASIVLFNVFFCIGLGPLVWGVAAGLFSPSVKGMAMGLSGLFSAVFGFFAIELFSSILQNYGFTAVFIGFGTYLFIGGICTIFFIPDTSRMTFQEIQIYLEGKRERII